jgi:hypothetical protein
MIAYLADDTISPSFVKFCWFVAQVWKNTILCSQFLQTKGDFWHNLLIMQFVLNLTFFNNIDWLLKSFVLCSHKSGYGKHPSWKMIFFFITKWTISLLSYSIYGKNSFWKQNVSTNILKNIVCDKKILMFTLL